MKLSNPAKANSKWASFKVNILCMSENFTELISKEAVKLSHSEDEWLYAPKFKNKQGDVKYKILDKQFKNRPWCKG